mgnify:CR=1 FL=1
MQQVVVETVVVKETVQVEVEKEVVKEATVLALPEVNPLEVTGDIVTAGSSTVFPLSEAMAERFEQVRGGAGELADWLVEALEAGQEAGFVAGEADEVRAALGAGEDDLDGDLPRPAGSGPRSERRMRVQRVQNNCRGLRTR